ncbi:MAG TPA: sulfatase-like hydrolase/transferase, partial [Pedobacter sp.]|nr:sulfatase-like hydrolase/transferase [Pedobacter sp.]
MKKTNILFFVFCFLAMSECFAQQKKKQAPNILMIAVDDLNDFVGAMGHPDAITPNIDRLAASGAIFKNAHCQAPLCGPSRASILTGLRPSSTGIYGMIKDNDIQSVNPLTKSTVFMHQYFKNAGYFMMGVGKIFHNHFPDGL